MLGILIMMLMGQKCISLQQPILLLCYTIVLSTPSVPSYEPNYMGLIYGMFLISMISLVFYYVNGTVSVMIIEILRP